jgi:hypothetical protein
VLVKKVADMGYDTSKLVKVPQRPAADKRTEVAP